MVDRIIYSKTIEWQHESEYRLAIPVGQHEEQWDTLPYHPEEITELYLGAAITNEDRGDIVSGAMDVNPKITIFQVKRTGQGHFAFEQFRQR